jgi:hypothetical protein
MKTRNQFILFFTLLLIPIIALAQIVPGGTGGSVSVNQGNATNLTVNTKLTLVGSSPQFVISNTAASEHERKWTWLSGSSGILELVAQSDGSSNSTVAAQFSRSGTAPTLGEWFFPTNKFYGDVYVTGTLISSNLSGSSKALKSSVGRAVTESTASGADLDNIAGLTANAQTQLDAKTTDLVTASNTVYLATVQRNAGTGTNITVKTKLSVPDGDLTVGTSTQTNHVAVNVAMDPNITVYIDNPSDADDTHGFKCVRFPHLSRDVNDQMSSGYFASHKYLNGHNINSEVFEADASTLILESGTISYQDQYKAAFFLDISSSASITNWHGLSISFSNASTNGGNAKNVRDIYVTSPSGVGTNGTYSQIELNDNTAHFTNTVTALWIKMNTNSDGKPCWGVRQSGTVSNEFDGPVYLNSSVVLASPIANPTGSSTIPSIYFTGFAGTGLYRVGTDSIGITIASNAAWQFSSSGHFLPSGLRNIGVAGGEVAGLFVTNITAVGDGSFGASGAIRHAGRTRWDTSADGVDKWRKNDAVGLSTMFLIQALIPIQSATPLTTATTNGCVYYTASATNTLSGTGTYQVGQIFKIGATNGATVTVRPNGSDRINGANSDFVFTGPAFLELEIVSSGNWVVTASDGIRPLRTSVAANTTLISPGYYVSTVTITNTLPVAASVAAGARFEIKSKSGITTTVRPGNGSDTIDQGTAGADDSVASLQHKIYVSDGSGNWEIN